MIIWAYSATKEPGFPAVPDTTLNSCLDQMCATVKCEATYPTTKTWPVDCKKKDNDPKHTSKSEKEELKKEEGIKVLKVQVPQPNLILG